MASMTKEQIVARLLRDGYGDLVTAIHQRETTAHAAACLVGYFRRKPIKSAPGEDNRSKLRLYSEAKLLRDLKR
jgi:hypothetical protein